MTTKAFLSYASEDSLLCREVIAALESPGLWEVHVVQPSVGTHLGERLQEEIELCQVFVIIITEHSKASQWVLAELAWAVKSRKRIIPLVQKGVSLDNIPSYPTNIEHIDYDPTNYESCLAKLRALATYTIDAHLAGKTSLTALSQTLPVQLIPLEEVKEAFWLPSRESRRPLEEKLRKSIQEIVLDYLSTPTVKYLLNIGTLRTDDFAVILRLDTLHALLRATRSPQPAGMRLAGYEAGTLYGAGVIKWFLAKTTEIRGEPALPMNAHAVVEACLEIDKKAGMARKIELRDKINKPGNHGWEAEIIVSKSFLNDQKEPLLNDGAEQAFWQGYLEGSFSSALVTWHWILSSRGHEEIRLHSARCAYSTAKSVDEMHFHIDVGTPEYERTFLNLQEGLLGPHSNDDYKKIVASASKVIDEFFKELTIMENINEDLDRALTWLESSLPAESKDALAYLQATRNMLQNEYSINRDLSEDETRAIVRTTGGAILQACHDIRLQQAQLRELNDFIYKRA